MKIPEFKDTGVIGLFVSFIFQGDVALRWGIFLKGEGRGRESAFQCSFKVIFDCNLDGFILHY